MAGINVENLSFSYNRKTPNLENVNMQVPRGTIYGLLGPSGCGKTTLLRCIVGRLKARQGMVTVFGYRPGTVQSGIPGPNIGYMPQELSLITQFTVRETLEYYAGFAQQGQDSGSLDSRIKFLLKLLDLSDFEHIFTDRLSGGQQRRVSLAVALINDPPLLILDEPTVGVDPILREAIWSYLVTHSKKGLTVIVTTHYIEEAAVADKVGFMRQGRILTEGNPGILMRQHCVPSMEKLFLKLSRHDDIRSCQNDFPKDLLLQMTSNESSVVTAVSAVAETPFNGVESTSYPNGGSASMALIQSSQKSQNIILANEMYIDHDLVSAVDSSNNNTIINNNNNIGNNSCCKVNISSNNNDQLSQPQSQLQLESAPLPVTKGYSGRTCSVLAKSRGVNTMDKIGVLCRKHRLRLFRRVPELVITMLLPALEVALFCLCMGRDPTSVQMAVCNQEDPPFLSLLFLKSIDSDFIALKYYKTPDEAIDSVRNADTYSAIVLAKNFTQALNQFGGGSMAKQLSPIGITISPPLPSSTSISSPIHSTKMSSTISSRSLIAPMPFSSTTEPNDKIEIADSTTMSSLLDPDSDDEDSIIRIYYDGSNALHVNIIRREVFSALFRFAKLAGKAFGGEIAGYRMPIKFEKPIYGTEKTDMVEFVGPGLMVFIVFFATMSITSMAFLSERREGTLERSLIVGMTPTEFIISQIINITFLLIIQITLTVVMGFWIFDFPMRGSYLLAVVMMFLQGVCGMTYGLMLSAICTNEMGALMLGAGSQLMFCFITGIFWPVETMIALLRYISYAMPQTKPMESFRHILIRGFDLSKPAVFNGYIITIAWTAFFLIVAIAIFRFR